MSRREAPHFVYEAYDATGACLYVGVSYALGERLAQHLRHSPWSPRLDTVKLTRYPDGRSGRAAEALRIRALQPEFNVAYTKRDARLARFEAVA